MTHKLISRRSFLIGAVVVVGGGLAAACSAPAAAPAAPTQSQGAAAQAPAPTQASAAAAAAATTAPAAKTSPSGVFRYAIDNDTETRKPVVEAFLAKNYPNVKAQFEVTPEGYFEKLLSQIAAKNPPDLAYIHESRFLDFASQGALQPLDPFMAKQPLIDGNDKYGLEILKNNNNYKGTWFTMPIGMAYLFVRYNKTMFEKAGVPLPTPSWTWDDLKSSAAKLTKDSADVNSKQWGWIGWDPGWMPSWWPLMQSYGAFHYNDDRTQSIINNPAGVQVLDYMRSTWADKVSPTPAAKTQLASGTLKLFEGGLAAMDYVLSPNVISSLQNIGDKFEMGIEEFPSGPKGQFVRTGGSSMSIPVGAKNPDLAWEVLRYMIGDEQANKDAATYMDGNPLVRLDYALKYNVPSGPLADKMKTIMTDSFQKHGTVVQYGPVGEYTSIVSATMDKLASGEMNAQQAADDIAAQTNKLLKEKQG
jgi:multiple sugar transport system substrate-binding protein